MTDVSILLVGNTDRDEFRAARASLDTTGRVTVAADLRSAVAMLAEGVIAPQLIVLAQAYPSQFSHEALDRLRRLAPLARVLGLLGSWCEGEMRTGKPWPAAIRIYWHQWPPRWHRQFARWARGECSQWTLPLTATEEERLLLETQHPLGNRQGLIAIYAWSYEMEDWLSAACRGRGLSTVWLRPPRVARVEGATAALFNGSDLHDTELSQLRHLVAALEPAPVIVLLDFPRIGDHRRALAAGAAAVVSKPLNLEDLFWELDRVLKTADRTAV